MCIFVDLSFEDIFSIFLPPLAAVLYSPSCTWGNECAKCHMSAPGFGLPSASLCALAEFCVLFLASRIVVGGETRPPKLDERTVFNLQPRSDCTDSCKSALQQWNYSCVSSETTVLLLYNEGYLILGQPHRKQCVPRHCFT